MRHSIPGWFFAAALCFVSGCEEAGLRSTSSARREYRTAPIQPGTLTVAEGVRFRVRLGEMLDSHTTHAGHRFATSLMDNVRADGGVVAIPQDATVYGYVAEVKRFANRTSMRLCFDIADLPDGRRLNLRAEPPQGSQIALDELGEKGAHEATTFLVQRGIDAVTAGVFFPVWMYMRAKKVYGFVTEGSRMVLPKGCIMTLELAQPVYVPPLSPAP